MPLPSRRARPAVATAALLARRVPPRRRSRHRRDAGAQVATLRQRLRDVCALEDLAQPIVSVRVVARVAGLAQRAAGRHRAQPDFRRNMMFKGARRGPRQGEFARRSSRATAATIASPTQDAATTYAREHSPGRQGGGHLAPGGRPHAEPPPRSRWEIDSGAPGRCAEEPPDAHRGQSPTAPRRGLAGHRVLRASLPVAAAHRVDGGHRADQPRPSCAPSTISTIGPTTRCWWCRATSPRPARRARGAVFSTGLSRGPEPLAA